jgi:hypothetical protein
LLESKFHEERNVGLLILVKKYEKDLESREDIFRVYVENTDKINNWDLVEQGKAPFINVECHSETVSQIPNMSYKDGERKTYTVDIHFCQKAKLYDDAFKGTSKIKGILDIKNEIIRIINNDPTINKQVTDLIYPVGYQSGFELVENGLFLAIAKLQITFFKDVFK